jgi:hypothetical protein
MGSPEITPAPAPTLPKAKNKNLSMALAAQLMVAPAVADASEVRQAPPPVYPGHTQTVQALAAPALPPGTVLPRGEQKTLRGRVVGPYSPQREQRAEKRSVSELSTPAVVVTTPADVTAALTVLAAKSRQELNHVGALNDGITRYERSAKSSSHDAPVNRTRAKAQVGAETHVVASYEKSIKEQVAALANFFSGLKTAKERNAYAEHLASKQNAALLLQVEPEHVAALVSALGTPASYTAAANSVAAYATYKNKGNQNDGRSDQQKGLDDGAQMKAACDFYHDTLTDKLSRDTFGATWELGLKLGIFSTKVSEEYDTRRADGKLVHHAKERISTWFLTQDMKLMEINPADRIHWAGRYLAP